MEIWSWNTNTRFVSKVNLNSKPLARVRDVILWPGPWRGIGIVFYYAVTKSGDIQIDPKKHMPILKRRLGYIIVETTL